METKEAVISTISEFNNNIDSTGISTNLDSSNDITNNKKDNNEELTFLLQLKEKTLVLFEGLKHNDKSTIESRLNIVIGYLEFQLSIIEDKINKIINKINNS